MVMNDISAISIMSFQPSFHRRASVRIESQSADAAAEGKIRFDRKSGSAEFAAEKAPPSVGRPRQETRRHLDRRSSGHRDRRIQRRQYRGGRNVQVTILS
jgi:hypothetical protein